MPKSSFTSSAVFLIGLSATAALAVHFDGYGTAPAQTTWISDLRATRLSQPGRGLEESDLQHAHTAWRYFEQNYQPATGLVDSVAGFPAATLWDQGSYLLGLVAARGLGLVPKQDFEDRTTRLLNSLEQLRLFENTLPNKVYNTLDLAMVDYENIPQSDGIGWSALDVARMLSALRVLELHHPQHGPQIRRVLARWNLSAMAEHGRLYGMQREEGVNERLQEGRIGYEQYAARSAAMWGLDVLVAGTAQPILQWRDQAGLDIPTDRRLAARFEAQTAVGSEAFFLQALEMGFTEESALLADRVFSAQQRRFERTGQLTMVSETNIDQAPHFLYNGIFGNGQDWAVLTEQGVHHEELRTVSLKAAFAWNAIYDDPYSRTVLKHLLPTATEFGWPSGTYESDGRINEIYTANTNAVVLQALYFKSYGPLMQLPE